MSTEPAALASFVERLGVAAQTQDEREAIAHLVGLEKLLRNKKWFDVATPEQQIASRFILGRGGLPDDVVRRGVASEAEPSLS